MESTSASASASPSPDSLAPDDDVFDYIAEPNENLICPICRNPFIDPVMCESTDHVFCRTCLIKSLEVSPTCPIDRQPLSLSLVIPAPKLINKLVDELLVSCPFKSKLGCSFICQRDLIAAHLRSHQAQLDHPEFCSSFIPKHQDQTPLNQTASQQPLPPQHSTSASSQLKFQWISGQAILLPHPPNQLPSSLAQTNPTANPIPNESESSHCPFQRFGCSFVGSSEIINEQHLSASPNPSTSSEDSRCPFLPVREILYWFEHLEARNVELKAQLSQSLVQQSKLTSVMDNLKASLRQLWLSRQSGHHPSPLLDPPTHPSLQFPTAQLASPFSRPQYPNDAPSTLQSNPVPIGLSIPDLSSPTRRSSDSFLHMNSSRMNYDSLNGHRLKQFDHYPSPSGFPDQFYRALGSPCSPSKTKIRVSTFLRRGEIITPATDNIENPPLPNESSSGVSSPYLNYASLQTRGSSASSGQAVPTQNPARLSPFSMFNIQPSNDPHMEYLNDELDSNSRLSQEVSIRQASALSEAVARPPPSEPKNEHVGLLNRKLSELIEAVQSSLKSWYPPGRMVLPNDLGSCDRAGPEARRQAVAAAHEAPTPHSTLPNSTDENNWMSSDDQQRVLSSLAKIEKLMGSLIEQGSTSRAGAESALVDASRRPSDLAPKSSSSSTSHSPASSSSILSPNRPLPPSSSWANSNSFLDSLVTPSGSACSSANYYPSSVRPMKL
ncbi:hypothetical protein VP01_3566g1 [Puccinia sorghi]|uniref:RING-type domain-containing protein n=1 Tax=Puccinia sorghi TaxID=27349 RepID=A0A0L6UVA7_9BASI|nr:hypothetical protein VP01_3566g1 [Puccinia sorghi]